MYSKTTSPEFMRYAKISDSYDHNELIIRPKDVHTFNSKTVNTYYQVNEEVIVAVDNGIAALVVPDQAGEPKLYVIHRTVHLNKNIKFNVISLTESATLIVSYQSDDMKEIPMKKSFTYKDYLSVNIVEDIYCFYYNVKGSGYNFSGEKHEYWEITYIDNGTLNTEIDGELITLEEQQIIFYLPGQFHNQFINKGDSASYFTIMFEMSLDEESTNFLKNKVFDIGQEHYSIITKFVKETGYNRENKYPYSSNLMVTYLNELVMLLLRYDIEMEASDFTNPINKNFENELVSEIVKYINNNLEGQIFIDDICDNFSISRSSLQSLFNENVGMPPMQYINEQKMHKSQLMIKKGDNTITEISDILGFSSIQYFSRKFKEYFGISPTAFSKSIKPAK